MNKDKPIEQWDKIDEVLNRGVEQIYPSKEALEKVLRSGKKLKLYLGVDPTGEDLHIGHAVPLNKLRQFQQLGHNAILLVADFTGMIGDPSGKSKARSRLTLAQVRQNAKYYKQQASKILNFSGKKAIKIRNNSEWLSKLSFLDFLDIATQLTIPQLMKRDMFRERSKAGHDIYLHEFIYPVMQGYDSVAMDVDLEIGGSDQLFNMLVGRDLLKKLKKRDKFVLTVPLLTDATGKKIGKTEGNVIAITAKPEKLYGLIMNLPDSVIIPCFKMITDIPMKDVLAIKQELDRGKVNPMNLKKKLAWTLVAQYNNKQAADLAQETFEKKYQFGGKKSKKAVAKKIPVSNFPSSSSITDIIILLKAAGSRSQAKRLIQQGAFRLNDQQLTNINHIYKPKVGDIIEIGKHKVYRVHNY